MLCSDTDFFFPLKIVYPPPKKGLGGENYTLMPFAEMAETGKFKFGLVMLLEAGGALDPSTAMNSNETWRVAPFWSCPMTSCNQVNVEAG